MRRGILILLLLGLVRPGRADAQVANSASAWAELHGIVRDSTSGRPVPGVRVIAGVGQLAYSDSLGRFRILLRHAPHTLTLRLSCERRDAPLLYWTGPRVHPRQESAEVALLAPGELCAPPLEAGIAIAFEGHWEPGFESSSFEPCADSGRDIWVELSEEAGAALAERWPKGEATEANTTRYFVRGRGRLRGPGTFGHMGGAVYELRILEFQEIRAPRRGDCR